MIFIVVTCTYLIRIIIYHMYFDTLDQGNARGHILHIALLVSLKSVVIENGSGSYIFIIIVTLSCRMCFSDMHSPIS